MKKLIYSFDEEIQLEESVQKSSLGSKGYNLALMTQLGFPVPGGFTIISDLSKEFFKESFDIDNVIKEELKSNIERLETKYSKKFGDSESPLLLSVRSGSLISMPGMMDTILNLGMNDKIAEGLAKKTSEYFAYDCYLRFIEMFSSVVLGMNSAILEKKKNEFFKELNIKPKDLKPDNLKMIIEHTKKLLKSYSIDFPENPHDQLRLAIKAVINSWNSQRAKIYRKLNNIPGSLGTAVTVQIMVFGNYDKASGTGVLFTRNPVDGTSEIYGEYLECAQGEDIVSGKRTPVSIKDGENSLKHLLPAQFKELETYCAKLESYYKDMQDIEFTIESGKLYILQTRSGKRTISSAVKIAHDLVYEHIISKKEAILRLDTGKIDLLLHPSISKKNRPKALTKGLAASPGAATGKIVFCSESAEFYSKNTDVILLRNDTCPEDIAGMSVSKAIVTARGGLTSHAAVVARGMGKPCVCGAGDMHIDFENKKVHINSHILNELDEVTIDGATGELFIGRLEVSPAEVSKEFNEMLEWADEFKTMNIRANAETELDLLSALKFNAAGIGLCRTEHMFFDKEKISLVRQMIISPSFDERHSIIERILPLHTNDFYVLFKLLGGKPINIRLIDPPLHEFLPKDDDDIQKLADEMEVDKQFVLFQLERMAEVNPMLGHRGSRLGITHPDIYQMQINAIITAALKTKKQGIPVNIEIMLPLISNIKELIFLKDLVSKTAQATMISIGDTIEFKLGTMIELPRAAIISDQIAKYVDYFSFGTNDLTQTVYGISRDDIANFMPEYKSEGIFENDPFQTIDEEGVGSVVADSIRKGREANKYLTLGICGEHGGDPKSIEFFNKVGMDYVSCSPYRIPAARIAAAQAAIRLADKV